MSIFRWTFFHFHGIILISSLTRSEPNNVTQSRQDAKKDPGICTFATLRLCVRLLFCQSVFEIGSTFEEENDDNVAPIERNGTRLQTSHTRTLRRPSVLRGRAVRWAERTGSTASASLFPAIGLSIKMENWEGTVVVCGERKCSWNWKKRIHEFRCILS